MDGYRIADAIESVMEMLHRANKYIDETTPWALAKDEANKARLGTVLWNLLETIRVGASLLWPIIPTTCDKIMQGIGTSDETLAYGILNGGRVSDIGVLFARVDEAKLLEEIAAEREAKAKAAMGIPKPEGVAQIGIEDFMNVELRTAQVKACEPVPKAKKLLKLTLDLGYEERTVVSGIAEYYKPDDMIGKKLIVVANLKPAVLRGVESQGMILASSGEDTTGDTQVRVVFLDPETPLGQRVR